MKVKSIAECSEGSILQYFWPAFSDNWSFLSVRLRQVLLYESAVNIHILTDFNYTTLTSPYIFQKTVECKLP